jgi:hypothetical protein
MNKDEIKAFFEKVLLTGSNYERAKTVVEYLKSRADGHGCEFVCIVGSTYTAYCYIDETKWLEFENNGITVRIGRLSKLSKIEDFKRNVILAIDSAEIKGGSLAEKRERFCDVFKGNVNIIIRNDPTDRYFTYRWECYHTEKRGDTTYDTWLI